MQSRNERQSKLLGYYQSGLGIGQGVPALPETRHNENQNKKKKGWGGLDEKDILE